MKFNRIACSALLALSVLPIFAQTGKSAGTEKKQEAKKGSDSIKAQEEVASKSAKFATIAESSKEVKAALGAKDLEKARKLFGKDGSFVGVVEDVYSPKHHKVVYINFSRPFENTISGSVGNEVYAKFPVLKDLKGKKVLITGKFRAYKETHPEISIKDLSQIKIVETKK